jgi:hypothetical protein
MNNFELLQSEYQRAGELYSSRPPSYSGKLVVSKDAAYAPTIDLGPVFDTTIQTLNNSPTVTQNFASTFGKLGVYLALDAQATSFTIAPENSYPKGSVTEIATTMRRKPSEFLSYQNDDTELSFVLCDEPGTAELILIQALHMFDSAIVTGLVEPGQVKRPMVFSADIDAIAKLRQDNPKLLIRLYGNVRGLSGAPTVLGLAAPTRLIEQSGIELIESKPLDMPGVVSKSTKNVFVGITTAKKPHIGHGFLLAKAVGEAGKQGQVIVELNDRGPRVAAMVAQLAAQTGKPFKTVADNITDGEVDQDTIEAAYTARSTTRESLPEDFALTKPNLFYKRLLTTISPLPSQLSGMSDSEAIAALAPVLEQNDSYRTVFGDSKGMGILAAEEQAVVVKKAGETTVAGLFGLLATRGNLAIVDSPQPLTRDQMNVFVSSGLSVEASAGIGVSIDFAIGSGTSGNSLPLKQLLDRLEQASIAPNQLLVVLRDMLEQAYYIPGEGNSINPNYASVSAVESALEASLNRLETGDIDEQKLFQPLRFCSVSKSLASSVLGDMFPDCATGKVDGKMIGGLLELFPILGDKLSTKLLSAFQQDPEDKISKNLVSQADQKLLQTVRTANPPAIFDLCAKSYDYEPDVFGPKLEQSKLGSAALAMGYTPDTYLSFLKQLKEVKGIYATI